MGQKVSIRETVLFHLSPFLVKNDELHLALIPHRSPGLINPSLWVCAPSYECSAVQRVSHSGGSQHRRAG